MTLKKSLLEVKNLKINFKTYEGLSKVVDGINLIVHEGDSVGLVGESGCGKTITARTILGILPSPPAQITGKILFKGKNILEEKKSSKRPRFAFIPQEAMNSLSHFFTVQNQMTDLITYQTSSLSFLRLIKNVGETKNVGATAKALESLDLVGIPDPSRVIKNYPFELSGGMRQRIFIALSLISDCPLIIADEPTTQLDVLTQAQIVELMRQKVKGQNISMLYITHNLGIARTLCDIIYVMYAGQILEIATTQRLFENSKHPYTKALIDAIPKISAPMSKGLKGGVPEYYNPPSGCRFHPRCKYSMKVCKQLKPELLELEHGHKVACYLHKAEC